MMNQYMEWTPPSNTSHADARQQQLAAAHHKELLLAQPARNASFGEAVKRFFVKYARFNGCASRREYWFAQLFVFLCLIVVAAMVFVGVYLEPTHPDASSVLEGIGSTLGFILLIGAVIPSISILARRLHDANMSAGFLFLMFTPGMVALPFMAMMPSNELGLQRFPGLTREERAFNRSQAIGAAVTVGVLGTVAVMDYRASRAAKRYDIGDDVKVVRGAITGKAQVTKSYKNGDYEVWFPLRGTIRVSEKQLQR